MAPVRCLLAALALAAAAAPSAAVQPLESVAPAAAARSGLDNGVGTTPTLGWNSWNAFRDALDEKVVRDTADLLLSTGLASKGYIYVNMSVPRTRPWLRRRSRLPHLRMRLLFTFFAWRGLPRSPALGLGACPESWPYSRNMLFGQADALRQAPTSTLGRAATPGPPLADPMRVWWLVGAGAGTTRGRYRSATPRVSSQQSGPGTTRVLRHEHTPVPHAASVLRRCCLLPLAVTRTHLGGQLCAPASTPRMNSGPGFCHRDV